jgi:hypothetical protein
MHIGLFLSKTHILWQLFLRFIVFLPFLLIGLAVAADGTFKIFQAAYPYVVRKLLSDNSLATRRLLNQVAFTDLI